MLVTLVTPLRSTVIVATPTLSVTENAFVLNWRSVSSFTIVTSALLMPSVAEPTGRLATLVRSSVNVRSALTLTSLTIDTVRFETTWPGANTSTLVIPV